MASVMEKSQAGKGTGVLEGGWSQSTGGETAASGLASSAQLPGEVAGPTAGPPGFGGPTPCGGGGGAARRGRLVLVRGGRRCPGSRVPSTLAAGSRGARCGDVCFPFASSFHKRRDPAGASGTQRAPRPPPESNGATRLPSMPRQPKQGALLSPRLSPVGFVFSQVTAGVSVLFLPSKGVYLIFKN